MPSSADRTLHHLRVLLLDVLRATEAHRTGAHADLILAVRAHARCAFEHLHNGRASRQRALLHRSTLDARTETHALACTLRLTADLALLPEASALATRADEAARLLTVLARHTRASATSGLAR